MKSILITGCNRGLGFGLVKHLARLPRPPDHIFATCRAADRAPELQTLAEKWKNIHILQLDVKDTTSYRNVVANVAETVGDKGLNVLMNNAGIAGKFTRLGLVRETALTESFLVNTVAPILLTKFYRWSDRVRVCSPQPYMAGVDKISPASSSPDCSNQLSITELRVHRLTAAIPERLYSSFATLDGQEYLKELSHMLYNILFYSLSAANKSQIETILREIVGSLFQAFLPLLKQAASNHGEKGMSVERAAVINMTSILSSIGQNKEGGYYPYRCSKSALNAATKSMSVDLRPNGILVACLHPGWVKTDMGGAGAPMEVDESIQAILSTLQKLNETHNGSFLQYNGTTLPW